MSDKIKSRVLVDIIEWEYPEEKRGWEPRIQDILDSKFRERFILGFVIGIFLEFRVEAESEDVLKYFYTLLNDARGVRPVDFSNAKKESLWLYQEGDKCWTKATSAINKTFAHIMVDPVPRPDRFEIRE